MVGGHSLSKLQVCVWEKQKVGRTKVARGKESEGNSTDLVFNVEGRHDFKSSMGTYSLHQALLLPLPLIIGHNKFARLISYFLLKR